MRVAIPIKDLSSSKSRLAHALPDHARSALMGAMLADLLDTLSECSTVSGIAVITRCPRAGATARLHGAEVLNFADDQCLNSGVSAAVTEFTRRNITEMMVLHGDLPLAESTDIDEVINSHRLGSKAVTLVTDSHKNGTNAMLLQLPSAMKLFFGQNSHGKHQNYCITQQISWQSIQNKNMGYDLDLWKDFQPLLSLRTLGKRQQLAHWLEQYAEIFDWPLAANL